MTDPLLWWNVFMVVFDRNTKHWWTSRELSWAEVKNSEYHWPGHWFENRRFFYWTSVRQHWIMRVKLQCRLRSTRSIWIFIFTLINIIIQLESQTISWNNVIVKRGSSHSSALTSDQGFLCVGLRSKSRVSHSVFCPCGEKVKAVASQPHRQFQSDRESMDTKISASLFRWSKILGLHFDSSRRGAVDKIVSHCRIIFA